MRKLDTVRALVVDDHDSMRTLLVRVLRRAGVADVREAAHVEAALALLENEPADLILADRRMPGMDGFALVRAVRGDARWSHARVLILTGDGAAEAEAREAGADAVLIKPAAPRDVLRAVEKVLRA